VSTKLRFKPVLIAFLLLCGALMLVWPHTKTVNDPLSGIWTGDWGTTPSHRNSVTVKLEWDGTNLRGAVNPGPHAVQFTKASFDTSKGAVHLELEVRSAGREIHYVIDGTIEGRSIIGTWNNEDNKGNFRLIRKYRGRSYFRSRSQTLLSVVRTA
jgi:hypothetical protein